MMPRGLILGEKGIDNIGKGRGSDAANIEVRWLPDFSCQVKLDLGRSGSRWVDSILDGHFVAGYRIWE
jgi:hypothetical protein